jgi:hypothetical protein
MTGVILRIGLGVDLVAHRVVQSVIGGLGRTEVAGSIQVRLRIGNVALAERANSHQKPPFGSSQGTVNSTQPFFGSRRVLGGIPTEKLPHLALKIGCPVCA